MESRKYESYLNFLEAFCKSFASYVTGNWRENHLNISVYLDEKPVKITCYGLGKVNWSGESDPEYPFHNCLQKLLDEIPDGTMVVDVEFNCGRMNKVNLTVE